MTTPDNHQDQDQGADTGDTAPAIVHPCNVCGLREATYALMALDDDTSGLFCGDCLVGTFTVIHAQQGAQG